MKRRLMPVCLLLAAIILCSGCNSATNTPEISETTVTETIEEKLLNEGLDNGQYKYDEYENHIEITKYLSSDKEAIIPSEIDGKPVTEIEEKAFFSCYSLQSVTIPSGVTKIGESAFSYCSLTSISIPDSVTEIGNWAFSFCSELTEVVIPDNVVQMEQYAFVNCDNLKSITYRGNVYPNFDEFYEAFAKENNIVITTEVTTTAPVTTTTLTTTTTAVTTTTVTTTETTEITIDPNYDYTGFDIAEYYPADENAEPLVIKHKSEVKPSLITEEIEAPDGIDKEKLELAKKAVAESKYYTRAVEQAKEIFSFENGTYTLNTEEPPFCVDGYEGYLDAEEAYRVNPRLIYADSELSGGNLFTFKIPLPMDFMDWSGHNYYYITVYVNQQNEAVLVPECCSQVLTKLESIYVGDSVHILANTGHSTGTANSRIISFNADGYNVEYNGTYIECSQNGANYILDDLTGGDTGWYQMLCYDKENGYIEVASHTLSGEAMEIICTHPAVLEKIPDIRSDCEDGYVYVVGGYISDSSKYATFTLKDGALDFFDGFISTGDPDSVSIIAENY